MKQLVPAWAKHIIKKYCWQFVYGKKIYNTGRAQNKICLQELNSQPEIFPELNVFTSHNEDGVLQYLFSKLPSTVNPVFVDIGSNDCINSNCANLAFHHNWSGVFIDGNKKLLNRGKHIYNAALPKSIAEFNFIHSIVTPQNIDDILNQVLKSTNIDLLSIDLDGNDYHIWNALKSITPKIVITEVQIEKGMRAFIPPYENSFEEYESELPKGASPLSMIELAKSKGYELVAFNTEGYNLFFVNKEYSNRFKVISSEDFKEHFKL
jgi:hypothetical protein